ncbi:hypothetical protein POSPLADRAFT_1052928 [Postia placenta MAD-698-R-SB12]|uniref:Uncharacterized protein n=1 Tax=Postia placenta MAD-698-R-SB12 TaxID=670580 RepID=A0A1X6NCA6_9APHY|nr:hypothetical protein POSPLADRAFT_1052928 [Postia placenta MAD-698-R-SB12]OSX66265.1 hypothetical protein POSPLADRAFT_1052928 [Postia placenta MAD-698-R-SB12]
MLSYLENDQSVQHLLHAVCIQSSALASSDISVSPGVTYRTCDNSCDVGLTAEVAKVLSQLSDVAGPLGLQAVVVVPSLLSALSVPSPDVRDLTLGTVIAATFRAYVRLSRNLSGLRKMVTDGLSCMFPALWDMSLTPLAQLVCRLS